MPIKLPLIRATRKRSNNSTSSSSSSSNQQDNYLVKLYQSVQRTNKLKALMSLESDSKLNLTENSYDSYEDMFGNSTMNFNEVSRINIQLDDQKSAKKHTQHTPSNYFNPNRHSQRKREYLLPLETKKTQALKLSRRSDWSRKSLFDLPEAKEFLKSQRERQSQIFKNKYVAQKKQLEESTIKQNLLVTQLLSNPKIDKRKLFNHMQHHDDNMKLVKIPIKIVYEDESVFS